MSNKVLKVEFEIGKISIYLSNPLKETQKIFLRDSKSGNEQAGIKVDDHIEILLKSAGSSLGNYEVWLVEEGYEDLLEGEETLFQNVRLSDYCYDWDRDIYMRCLRSEEKKLNIVISRVRDITGKQKLQIQSVKSGKERIELGVEKEFFQEVDDFRLIIVPNRREGMWVPAQNYEEEEEKFSIDLSGFLSDVELQGFIKKKWRFYIETMKAGQYNIYLTGGEKLVNRNQSKEADFYDYRNDYMDAVYSYVFEDKNLAIYPYLTMKDNLALMQMNEENKYLQKIMNKIKDIRVEGNGFTMILELHQLEEHKLVGVYLSFRTKTEEEKEEILCPITVKERKNDRIVAECYVDFDKVNIRPLYWDVRVAYEKNGVEYRTYLNNSSASFEKKYFKSLFARKTMTLKSGEIFYLYRTAGDFIAFQCRAKGEYDTLSFRLKERLAAFIYFILKPFWISRNIYLVYEKFCVMAQDNGYFFFKYCMENDVEKELNRRIYYVMDPKSPDWDKVAMYKNRVIPFMSIKHMVYLLASKLLISTDTIDHVYAWRPKDSILHQYLDSKKLVFLQHGVIALKQVHFLYSSDKRGRCSIFVTSNNMERDIIYDYFGYKMHQIAVTGLCRWDVLEDKSEGIREILIMPTWRNWLDEVSDAMFKESDYYHNYMSFLNSDWLKSYLEKYDLHLNFYLHPKFREYISNFKIEGERLRLIPFGEEPLNELMMRCKLLVTDYSSVCWDVFYQGKPVVFYQFDAKQYDEAHGSYIDFEKDLFGDRAVEPQELMSLLEEYAQNNFILKDKYAKMRKDCYKYIDKNNSKRICEEIVKRGW